MSGGTAASAEVTVGRPGHVETDIPGVVVAAFSEVLGDGRQVRADDDFFELGGNSILAAQLVARLREALGRKVTIRDLFRARTPAALALVIGQRRNG